MNKYSLSILISFILIFAISAKETFIPQDGYDTSVVKNPVFEIESVLVESTALNNWLNANYENLTNQQMKGPREHLYYLIDSYVKHNFAQTSQIYPTKHDLLFETLFSWSEKLGVYGGASVYNKLKSENSKEMSPQLELPSEISINLVDDLFVIASESQSWSMRIPFYFMIWAVNDSVFENGLRTQLIAFSTGAAKDQSEHGHSQATIMFIYTPQGNYEEVSAYWKNAMGVDDKAIQKPLNYVSKNSLYSHDKALNLHKEITTWESENGIFAVAFLGNEGAYQWNRPHFIDFLNTLTVDGE